VISEDIRQEILSRFEEVDAMNTSAEKKKAEAGEAFHTPEPTSNRPLEGIRVIEYCSRVSGPYCAKIMADLGAQVLKIESPRVGDESRYMGPFAGNDPHPEKSGFFLYLNTNKRGLTLNPGKPKGKDIFEKLVKNADVLIEDRPAGYLEGLGLGYEDLKKVNPGLIMTSITPFGRSGPYKDHKAYPLNLTHISGQGYLLPYLSADSKLPPVRVGDHASEYDPALVAVVAVLAALLWKGVSGRGQFIEVSKMEALLSMQRVESVTYANDGVYVSRAGGPIRMPGGVLPCKDGYVVIITPQKHQWEALLELIGHPDWSKEEWVGVVQERSKRTQEINEHLIDWLMQHTQEEIFRKGQALGCPVAPLLSPRDQADSEQFAAREFFQDIEHQVIGRTRFPTSPYRFSESSWRLDRPAPLLGEHNEEIYGGGLGYNAQELAKLKDDGVI
jgi:crotonobetainyl-CoA:carnitine CoA-transferase CaiB-like acyl-CoA transferase